MKMFNKSTNIGKTAETFAAQFLRKQGLTILRCNYSCRFGEIDIIAQDREHTIIFVEVRCRAERAKVSATESITSKKIQRIQKTAQFYFMEHKEIPACRFDVIAMSHNSDLENYNIEWIKDAF